MGLQTKEGENEMEEGKHKIRGWLQECRAGDAAGTWAGVCQRATEAGPATSCVLLPGLRGAGMAQSPQHQHWDVARPGSEPILCHGVALFLLTALLSSSLAASTPRLWGQLGGCSAPKVPSIQPGWEKEGKSPLTDFLGRPRGFLPGVTAAF